MRRYLLFTAIAAALLAGCGVFGTEPDERPVPAIAFAALEGATPFPDTTVNYSCGPGLFRGTTRTDSQGRYRFTLRFPDTLAADLPTDRRLGCLVAVPPNYRSSHTTFEVPTVEFVEDSSEVVPIVQDLGSQDISDAVGGTALSHVLYDLKVGEVKRALLSPCYPQCKFFGILLHPGIVEVTGELFSKNSSGISLTAIAPGTTTVHMYHIHHHYSPGPGLGIPDDTAFVGAIGVRVR